MGSIEVIDRVVPRETSINHALRGVIGKNLMTTDSSILTTLRRVQCMIEIKRSRLNHLPTIQQQIAAQEDLDTYIANHANILFD